MPEESMFSQEVTVASEKVKAHRNFIAPTLAVIIILGVFALFYVFTYTDCKSPKEVTFFILGAASGWVSNILTFYFGSSQGSQAKDKLLAEKEKK